MISYSNRTYTMYLYYVVTVVYSTGVDVLKLLKQAIINAAVADYM